MIFYDYTNSGYSVFQETFLSDSSIIFWNILPIFICIKVILLVLMMVAWKTRTRLK